MGTLSQKHPVTLIRAAAVIQGLALVVIPTVSTVLTSAHGLALSASEYGALFVPQSILAVICSFAGIVLTRRRGARVTLIAGFSANAAAMALIAGSAFLDANRTAAFAVLLGGTSLLGSGFALVTPTLNVLAGTFEPNARDRAVLIVNALLGGAAAAAPLLLVAFVKLGYWWGLPSLCALGMLVLIAACLRVSFGKPDASAAAPAARAGLPRRIALFAAFAFVYGLCEQLNGSWAPIYMTHHLGATLAFGSLALALFWAVATAARVGFALYDRVVAPAVVFRALPVVLAAAFAALAVLPAHAAALLGVAAFALAGLGVSALLPLVLSFCERSIPTAATAATSVTFATYLLGYGTAAFGVGPLQHLGISIPALDAAAVGLAVIVAILAFAIAALAANPARA